MADGFADEFRQGIQRLLVVTFGLAVTAARAFDLRFDTAQIARRHQSGIELQFGEAIGFLAALQHVFGECHLCFADAGLVVGFGDRTDDAQLCGIAGFAGGEIGLQGFFVQRFDPSVEVEFVGAGGKSHSPGFANARLAGAGEVSRGAAASTRALGVHRRQVVSALDAVLGFGDFDAECRVFQVVIVRQRFADELLQLRIAEVFAPAEGVGGGSGSIALFADGDFHPVLRQGDVGLFVVGSEGAAPQPQGQRDGF